MTFLSKHQRGGASAPLVFDLETHKFQEHGPKIPKIVCLAAGGRLFIGDQIREAAAAIVAHPGPVVGQNVAFDFGCIAAAFPDLLPGIFGLYERGQVHDTRIREQLIAIAMGTFDRRRFSLADLVKNYQGISIGGKTGDVWRLKYHQLDGVLDLDDWPAAAKQYALDDIRYTREVFEAQERLSLSTDAGRMVMPLKDEADQTRAAWALHLIGIYGMKIDQEKAAAWIAEVEADAAKAFEIATAAGFMRTNGTKDLSVLRGMLDQAYDGKAPRTEKGSIKTDTDTLKNSGHPTLLAYSESKAAEKLANTYAPILKNGPTVHPSYQALVKSGRTSCRRPNMQNPPRGGGFRGCFKPRDGRAFVLCDYDQIELLALGQIHLWMFGSSALVDAVNAGRDLHLEVAAKLNPEDPPAFRQFAKVANYGFPGGLSAESFMEYAQGFGLDVDRDQAEEIRAAWLDTWPEMRGYFREIGNATRWGNTTVIQWISERQRGGCSFTQAANSYFQGLVADGAKAALWEVSRQVYTDPASDLFGCPVVAFLHDEIILEAPIGVKAGAAAVALEKTMVETMRRFIPDVKVAAGAVISTTWIKG